MNTVAAEDIRTGQLVACGTGRYEVLHAWTSGPTTRLYAVQRGTRRKVELRFDREARVPVEDGTMIDLARAAG